MALGTAIVLAAVAIAAIFREGPLGNVASIVGLAVSVLGFAVTIWTVRDARHQIKEAAERAEQAVAQGREETRRAVERIAAHLFAADCAALRSGIEDLRQAALDRQWARAIFRCQACRVTVYRLAEDRHLTREEALAMLATADDLQLILRFIEENRKTKRAGPLEGQHVERLDSTIALLAQMQARFLHESLRPAEPENQ